MNIVIINNLYGPYARGGAERLVVAQAAELSKQGHTVTVVASRPPLFLDSGSPRRLVARNDSGGADTKGEYFFPWNIASYYHLNKLPVPLRLAWHVIDMFNVQSYFKIKKLLKQKNADMVITHNLKGVGLLTPRAIKAVGASHIHTLHDIQLLHPSGLMYVGEEQAINGIFARLYQWVNKKLFANVDVVISPSQWLLDLHVQHGFFAGAKRAVVRNPAAGESGTRNQELKRTGGGMYTFLYAGQMERHKGVAVLLDAFAQMQKDGVHARLHFIGDGSLKSALQKQAEPLGDAVTFLPWEQQTYRQELAAADCVVVPSICYENYPTTIVDARAANVWVIASAIGGIPELLKNGGGIVCKAGDSMALAQVMQGAINGSVPFERAAASERQSIDTYIEKLLALC